MFTRTRSLLQQFFLPLIVLAIAVFLSAKNFTPNTFLSGWDTLHPEFNLSYAFQNIISGVWRGDQGVGAIAGHSHMSELPRLIFLAISSIVLPLNFLRYFYFFVCLTLAPLGMYVFLQKTFKNRLASFLGSLLYLLNLSTVQVFYVPFEMFAALFAFLPWIFWATLNYFDNKNKKNLFLFALLSFLASPMAYAASLFYAFFLVWIFWLIFLRKYGKSLVILFITMLTINSYWILPNLYSITNQSTEISKSTISSLFTPEAFLSNKAYGNFRDIVLGKNYLFSWRAYDFGSQKFVDLMANWQSHLSDPRVLAIGYGMFVIAVLGILIAIFKRQRLALSFIPVLLVPLFFIINDNFPIAVIYEFLQHHLPVFNEGFRMPYTKFATLFFFVISFYFAYFWSQIFRVLKRIKFYFLAFVITIFVSGGLIMFCLPAFSGQLISPLMRIKIPGEYFQAFDWFNKNPKGRVAILPAYTQWGWEYRNWGFQGAGFEWFGIPDPVLTRDFDRWSANNESFYNELSFAIYNSDTKSVNKILQKYDVKYVFVDSTAVNAGGSNAVLKITQIDFVKKVQFGPLTIYEIGEDNPANFVRANYDATYGQMDNLYQSNGNYISDANGISYPFVNLDDRSKAELTVDGGVAKIEYSFGNQNLYTKVNIPSILSTEKYVPVEIYLQSKNEGVTVKLLWESPKILINNKEVWQNPVSVNYFFAINPDSVGFVNLDGQTFRINKIGDTETLVGSSLVSLNGSTDLSLYAKIGMIEDGYLPRIKTKSAELCSNSDQKVSKKDTNDGFSLEINKDSVCIGEAITAFSSSLAHISFLRNQNSDYVCVTKSAISGCLNKDFVAKSDFYLPVNISSYWLAFVAGSTDKNHESQFRNITIAYYNSLGEKKVDLSSALKIFDDATSLNINGAKKITVTFPLIANTKESFANDRGFGSANNCDLEKLGEVTKEFNKDGVFYSAKENGVSCDYFDYRDLHLDQGYILNIAGQNFLGRSLKFYLQNINTDRMDMEKLLPTGNFDNSYFVLPKQDGNGYVVNVETRSFGPINSVNQINNIEFIAVPLSWMQNLNLTSRDESFLNAVNVKSVTKFGLLYKIAVDPNSSGILPLSQGFEKGWVAFGKNLEHVKINSWENGWVVPQGYKTIYIFYLPQILEWFGFALIALSSFAILAL